MAEGYKADIKVTLKEPVYDLKVHQCLGSVVDMSVYYDRSLGKSFACFGRTPPGLTMSVS